MEKPYSLINIADNIDLVSVPSSRFKTSEISISMALPIEKSTVSANALAIYLLSRSCEKYPNFTLINNKLAMLYGATLLATVTKVGESQVLSIGITALDDRFSLDNTSIARESIDLILNMLFNPCTESGTFKQADIELEKRLLIEKIESEENEKRIYAVRRLEEEMFKAEPYGINRFGSIEQVNKLTSDDVYNAWQNLIKTSKVMVALVGNANVNDVKNSVETAFSKIQRTPAEIKACEFVPTASMVNTVEERMDINQGKLVLGFRVDMKPDDEMTAAMRTTVDIFGGGPYSRLFTNVREKMSLCYYCNARYIRAKSMVLVQCGCEEENMEKAINEIVNQLDVIKKGEFEKSEFEASIMGMADAINSVNDSPEGLESWYINQITDKSFQSPAESVEENNKVKLEDVSLCAKKITLDTVYKLMGNKEGN